MDCNTTIFIKRLRQVQDEQHLIISEPRTLVNCVNFEEFFGPDNDAKPNEKSHDTDASVIVIEDSTEDENLRPQTPVRVKSTRRRSRRSKKKTTTLNESNIRENTIDITKNGPQLNGGTDIRINPFSLLAKSLELQQRNTNNNNYTHIPPSTKAAQAGANRKNEHTKLRSKRSNLKKHRLDLQKALAKKIDSKNLGYQLLQKMGYQDGQGLGRSGNGISEPLGILLKFDRKGLGEQPKKAKRNAKNTKTTIQFIASKQHDTTSRSEGGSSTIALDTSTSSNASMRNVRRRSPVHATAKHNLNSSSSSIDLPEMDTPSVAKRAGAVKLQPSELENSSLLLKEIRDSRFNEFANQNIFSKLSTPPVTEPETLTNILDFYQNPIVANNASNSDATRQVFDMSMLDVFPLNGEVSEKPTTNVVQSTKQPPVKRASMGGDTKVDTPIATGRGSDEKSNGRAATGAAVHRRATKVMTASVTKSKRERKRQTVMCCRSSPTTSKPNYINVITSTPRLPRRQRKSLEGGPTERTQPWMANRGAVRLPNVRALPTPPPPPPSMTIRKFSVYEPIDNDNLQAIAHVFRNEISAFRRKLNEQAFWQPPNGSDKWNLIVVKMKMALYPLTAKHFEDVRSKFSQLIGRLQLQNMPTPIFHSITYDGHDEIRVVCEDEHAYNCLEYYFFEQQLLSPVGVAQLIRMPKITTLLYCFSARYETIHRDPHILLGQIKLHYPHLNAHQWVVVTQEVEELHGRTQYILIVDERSALDITYHFNRSMLICMHALHFWNRGIVP